MTNTLEILASKINKLKASLDRDYKGELNECRKKILLASEQMSQVNCSETKQQIELLTAQKSKIVKDWEKGTSLKAIQRLQELIKEYQSIKNLI